MGFSKEIDTSTDADKIDYIYKRLRRQERGEIANAVWKWTMRGLILLSLLQIYLNPGSLFWGLVGTGGNEIGSHKESVSQMFGDYVKEATKEAAKEARPSGLDEALGTAQPSSAPSPATVAPNPGTATGTAPTKRNNRPTTP